jgi:molybdopterin synthase catalytic subunit
LLQFGYDHRVPEVIDTQLVPGPVHVPPLEKFPQPAGAECIFLGRTRIERHADHGSLQRLTYEAYRPMAERVLADLAAEAVHRYQCLLVRIHHAIGEVPPGCASVLVQVVTAHRAEAFAACRYLIDAIKFRVPIWKCEAWEDGSTWSEGTPVSGAVEAA